MQKTILITFFINSLYLNPSHAFIKDTIQFGPAVEVMSNHRINNTAPHYENDEIIHVVPIGFVKLGPLMINDIGVQLSFIQTLPFAIFINGNFHGEEYDSTNLMRREESLFAGGGIRIYPLSIFTLKDMESKSQGYLTRFQIQAPLKLGNWLFFTTLGYTYFDKLYSDYYYGVSSEESSSALAAYEPGSSSEFFLNLKIFYTLNDRYELYFMGEHKEFSKTITDSPTVNINPLFTGTLGFMYKFY